MRRFVSYGPALVVLLTVVASLIAVPAALRRIGTAHTAARIVLAQRSLDDDDILERLNRAVRNVAETVRPSVVHIEVVAEGTRRTLGRSTGTGWVFDHDGHVITNAHVVRGAAAISIQFADGRVVDAERIDGQTFVADPYTDIAVIKVGAENAAFPARRATGIQPQQGDRVFVFGSPFGFKFSMSEGIISGLGRDPQSAAEANGFTNFIQTDAAVNPGNSGGPLVDIKGRVIGMNVAIATGRNSDGTIGDEGQSAGISFAIPLGTIESVASQLIERGEVRRGYLGVRWGRPDAANVYDAAAKASGVRVDEVTQDGPAAKAGIEADDVILAVGDQATPSVEVMRSVITTIGPGQTVHVKLSRKGTPKEVSVTLSELGGEALAQVNSDAARRTLERYGLFLGARRLDLPAVIRRVAPESQAEEAGFKVRATILAVGKTPVKTIGDVYLAAADQGLLLGKKVPLLVAEEESENTSAIPQTIDVQVLH
jgi:serine protease Do